MKWKGDDMAERKYKNSGKRWSPNDESIILGSDESFDSELSKKLARSVRAIRDKRSELLLEEESGLMWPFMYD